MHLVECGMEGQRRKGLLSEVVDRLGSSYRMMAREHILLGWTISRILETLRMSGFTIWVG